MSVVDSNRERRENREQIRECLRKPLIHSQKGLPKGICPKSRATGVFSLSSILPPVVAQNLRKFVWSVSPCSYCSRCSRFIEFKRSVPSSPPCSYPSRCSRFMFLNGVSPVDLKRFKVESKEKVSPPLQGGNQEPLRKKRPLFVPFPLFAVHGIYRECPL